MGWEKVNITCQTKDIPYLFTELPNIFLAEFSCKLVVPTALATIILTELQGRSVNYPLEPLIFEIQHILQLPNSASGDVFLLPSTCCICSVFFSIRKCEINGLGCFHLSFLHMNALLTLCCTDQSHLHFCRFTYQELQELTYQELHSHLLWRVPGKQKHCKISKTLLTEIHR